MATPERYDYPTFRYYLEMDVLQETAKFLEWVDINPEIPTGVRVTPVVGDYFQFDEGVYEGNKIFLDAPLENPIPAGTQIKYERPDLPLEDFFATVKLGAQTGDTVILVEEVNSVADWEVSYSIIETNLPYRDAQPIYDAITDEVVLQLGYTHPELVPADKIQQMEALGRAEAWRKVVHNTMTDIDVTVNGLVYFRSQFHQMAIKRWNIALNEYNETYLIPFIKDLNYTQPQAKTYSGAVNVRW